MRRYVQCRPPLESEWLIDTVSAGRGGYEAYFELLKEGTNSEARQGVRADNRGDWIP